MSRYSYCNRTKGGEKMYTCKSNLIPMLYSGEKNKIYKHTWTLKDNLTFYYFCYSTIISKMNSLCLSLFQSTCCRNVIFPDFGMLHWSSPFFHNFYLFYLFFYIFYFFPHYIAWGSSYSYMYTFFPHPLFCCSMSI